jgi:hypothetical protein
MYINLIYTSQKTHLPFKTNYLTLFRETTRVFFSLVMLIQSVEKMRRSKILKHVVQFISLSLYLNIVNFDRKMLRFTLRQIGTLKCQGGWRC